MRSRRTTSLEAIEASKEQPFYRVLSALGIAGIGGVNARKLTAHFRTIDALLEADPEQIAETEGIGPILAEQLAATLAEERTRKIIERLRAHGLKFEEKGPAPGTVGPLAGKTFVITGTLPEHVARGGDRADRGGRRQGDRLGVEEDRLPGRRRRPGRLEVEQGAGDRHRGDRRADSCSKLIAELSRTSR